MENPNIENRSLESYDKIFSKALHKLEENKDEVRQDAQIDQSGGIPVVKKVKKRNTFANFFFKLFLIFAIFSFISVPFIAISVVTGLDKQIIGLKFEGQVFDSQTNAVIPNPEILFNKEKVITGDVNGRFVITNLKEGTYEIIIAKEGFSPLTDSISVKSKAFQYTSTKTFVLEQDNSFSGLKGKLVTKITGYKFDNDKLTIGNKEVAISEDGSFELGDIALGEADFSFKSDNFVDISKKIEIKAGGNVLEDVVLKEAGNIEGKFVSFIREDLVQNVTIQIENVFKEQITVDSEGNFVINDLDVGREYNVRVLANSYESRDYKIIVARGKNFLKDFRLVEEGQTYFVAEIEPDSSLNFYVSEFDGYNRQKLTNDPELDPENFYYSELEDVVYFQTSKDGFQNPLAGPMYPVYTLNLKDRSINRLTSNTTGLGRLVPNYKAFSMVNVYTTGAKDQRFLELMNLYGNDRKPISSIAKGEFEDILISNNAKQIYYVKNDTSKGTYGLYKYDLSTAKETLVTAKKQIYLYSLSDDGSRLIFSAKSDTANFRDLLLYDSNTSEIRTLKSNATGRQYQFIEGNNNSFIYWDKQNNRDNIFEYKVDSNSVSQVSRLGTDDRMEYIYQQSKYIYYKTQRGLYVIDLSKPNSFKLVTSVKMEFKGMEANYKVR